MARRCCMQYLRKFGNTTVTCYRPFRKDLEECKDGDDVVQKVCAEADGIGFIQFTGRFPKDVKVLAVSKDDSEKPVAPSEAPVIQDDYPLSEKLVFYIHPTKPGSAMKFAECAVGPESSRIMEKQGLITPYMQARYESMLRLKDMKSGKGLKLTASGAESASPLAQILAVGYVRSKPNALVQMHYSASETDTVSIGTFAMAPTGGDGKAFSVRQLLFLEDRPSDQAMKIHGDKWNTLNPKEYLPAGRAVAVVVPAASKVNSLTLEQVKSIFSGQVKEWKLLGAAGVSGRINCYGVPDIKGESVSMSASIDAAIAELSPVAVSAAGGSAAKPSGSPAAARLPFRATDPSASQASSIFRREVSGMTGVTMKRDTAEACTRSQPISTALPSSTWLRFPKRDRLSRLSLLANRARP